MSIARLDDDFATRMRGPSRTIWMIGATVLVFLIWSALAWVDEIVHAPGQVVSLSRPQIIQNLEGGILAELLVGEGDVVEQGQTLARLYGTEYQSAVDQLRDQIAALEARRLRLQAEMAGVDRIELPDDILALVPDIAASERALLVARLAEYTARVQGGQAILDQATAERDLLEKMYKREVAPLIEVTRARKAFSDAENRLSDAINTTKLERATEFAKTQSELANLRQKLTVATDQLQRTVLVSPLRGVVNKLSVTTIGGVVRSGEEIMQIIPLDEEVFIEARVKPRDIAAVQQGQDAVIKLTAYDYTIYGTIKARVTFISADTFKDDRSRSVDGDPHYKVTLSVQKDALTGRQKDLEIRPGMQADVELQTGGKTVLSYLTKPLYKSNLALRER